MAVRLGRGIWRLLLRLGVFRGDREEGGGEVVEEEVEGKYVGENMGAGVGCWR